MRVLLGKEDIGIHLKDLPYFPSFVRRGEGVVSTFQILQLQHTTFAGI